MTQHNVARYDKGEVRGDAKLTDEGYIKANAVVTRTGVFLYKNSDGSIRRELRHPSDVLHVDSIASMEMIPVTNGHPIERLVTAENAKRLAIGYTGETIKRNGDYLLANLVITDSQAVKDVMDHNRKQLSLGYTVDLIEEKGVYQGEAYDARQTNIKYNHLAIVENARAGKEARIALDSLDAEEITKEENQMSKKKVKIDAEEIFIESEAADYIERLQEDLRNLNDEKARVESKLRDAEDESRRVKEEIEMIQNKLEKASAERDGLKDKVSEFENKPKMDEDEFKKAVSNRLKLYQLAENYLNQASLSKLDSLSDLEIKKAVIQSCRKSVNLDGKSDVYVEAMFDSILDDNTKTVVNTSNVSYSRADQNSCSAEDAQKIMMERLKNAHKGGK